MKVFAASRQRPAARQSHRVKRKSVLEPPQQIQHRLPTANPMHSLMKLTVADPMTGAALAVAMDDVFLANGFAENSQRHVFEKWQSPSWMPIRRPAVCSDGLRSNGDRKTHDVRADGGNVRYFHSVDARGLVPRIAEYLLRLRATTSW